MHIFTNQIILINKLFKNLKFYIRVVLYKIIFSKQKKKEIFFLF